MRHIVRPPAATALAAFLLAGGAAAAPLPSVQAPAAASQFVEVGDLCGNLGNCGVGKGGTRTIPRHTLKPDIGRFDPGHHERFGRYRYEPPQQDLNLDVPRLQRRGLPATPRYTGTRTIYRVEKLSADHVDWCYARYKSYRAKDNTYQPAKGPRKVCVSPFS